LVHDPKDIPKDWNEWVICGHHHNNYPMDFPLINGKTKMINVGVELINYTPLNIENLFDLDFEKIEFMEKVGDKPIKKY
jgi:calcineurin-like phosphoesterase family protein